MSLKQLLQSYRATSQTTSELGKRFERLTRLFLLHDPRYAPDLEEVYLWNDFPYRDQLGSVDMGIDLVGKTKTGEYWAVQCKCYDAGTTVDTADVGKFIANASQSFVDEQGQRISFGRMLWVDTAERWTKNARTMIENQTTPFTRLDLAHLQATSLDWDELDQGKLGQSLHRAKKELRPHQTEAIEAAQQYYAPLTEGGAGQDRGKLIMACGTGKTFTSLRLVETLLPQGGVVLFLVPSISLLGQSLNDWFADAQRPLRAVCICSDSRASQKRKRSQQDDQELGSTTDLARPATTSVERIVEDMLHHRAGVAGGELLVVFSTYQSIEVVHQAQRELLGQTEQTFGRFDFVICDEAHRTTGVSLTKEEASHFTRVHDADYIQASKRLYMTATPRLYTDDAKKRTQEVDGILCSMDDESLYGREIYRVNFDYAVRNGILTDYKVLVLTISEDMIPENLVSCIRPKDGKSQGFTFEDTGKLIGVINALSKRILGDEGKTWDADPKLMKRVLAFTHRIGSEEDEGTSKNIAHILPQISQMYNESLSEEDQARVVRISACHVDGSMGTAERNNALSWLAEETEDAQECRLISNVRCLSEGVDVPALDAVVFLSARSSEVDVVQSVGRVMRSFRKGKPDEKKYGYIIIPVVVPEGVSPQDALTDGSTFSGVWRVLNSLRAHDDHFNATVNSIALNKEKPSKVTIGPGGFIPESNPEKPASTTDTQTEGDALTLSRAQIAQQLTLRFGDDLRQAIYAKLVEKCGDRMYWENWAGDIGKIARRYQERITRLVQGQSLDAESGEPASGGGVSRQVFAQFVSALRQNLNPSISEAQAIEMLAQHLITKPVFEVLFREYDFVHNNSISASMEQMIQILQQEGVDQENKQLQDFYDSVGRNVGQIDNLEGKQTIIKNLYERFFRGAFRDTVDRLGIVYTPVECVDFIIRSVDALLSHEFDTALTREGVHILDPFAGTGTFVTRLLQSGLIRPEDLRRKYQHEIHCNELVMLAYYIADVNIESVYQSLSGQEEYLAYDGICLTDTFQMGEEHSGDLFRDFFRLNSEAVERQRNTPVRVIIGNPPYSVGQRSANDNNKNLSYPKLEQRISDTYARLSSAQSKKALQDTYLKAFRWSTDRLEESEEGGILAFISNGTWLDGTSQDGFRASLASEFDKIYVLNLRGDARSSGEFRKKEGEGVFDEGSRTPISISFLIRYDAERRGKEPCQIFYHDIGDYLSREQKLDKLQRLADYSSVNWQRINPTERFDWINQRDGLFESLIPLTPEKKFDRKAQAFFSINSPGIAAARDGWVYGFSRQAVEEQMQRMIACYNQQIGKEDFTQDKTQISWTDGLHKRRERGEIITYDSAYLVRSIYRPFTKEHLYYHKPLIERPAQFSHLFPEGAENLVICISGIGGKEEISCLITDCHADYQTMFNTQCYPLYWYEQIGGTEQDLFDGADEPACWVRHEAITDWALQTVRAAYPKAGTLTKEDIFYFVYGLLHSSEYRERFAADLRKGLPRLPLPESEGDFFTFSGVGRQLAELHLGYEGLTPPEGVRLEMDRSLEELDAPTEANFAYCQLEKMRHPKKGQTDTIIYNSRIAVVGIPPEAYGYVVNGRTPLGWVMERYQRKQDRDSALVNDPNGWMREEGCPTYVLRLLLSLVRLSLETQELVRSLPSLSLPV